MASRVAGTTDMPVVKAGVGRRCLVLDSSLLLWLVRVGTGHCHPDPACCHPGPARLSVSEGTEVSR